MSRRSLAERWDSVTPAEDPKAWRRTIQTFAAHVSPQVGQPWKPFRWVNFVADVIMAEMARCQETGARIIVNAPPRHGKALAVDTPIPTPVGWRCIGDLRVGDLVFDEDGIVTPVVAVSEVWRRRRAFRCTSDAGFGIVADAAHEWKVRLERKRPLARTIWETQALAARTSKRNPMVDRHSGLLLPTAELPIEPYTLGFWLGDGRNGYGSITVGDQDQWWVLRRIGCYYTISPQGQPTQFGVLGLQKPLRETGLLRNKHIPAAYLRASIEQRWTLLQGLIDSDGFVAEDGQIEFCSTEERLARDVRELVSSLGYKASLVHGRATLYGKDCGPKYRVMFYAPRAASIPRKASRCVEPSRSPNHYLEFEETDPVDTVCIEVASDRHTFLAGEGMIPTCNSELISKWVPAWFLELFPELGVILASYEASLAEHWGRAVRDIFERCPELWTKVRPDARDASSWQTLEGGGMRTIGVGGGVTGRGGHLLIVDDPCRNWADAHSPVLRERERYWFDSTFYTRRDKDCAHIIVLMTRWAEPDLTGYLLKEHGDQWLHVKLPQLAEADDPLGRAEGETLCPERVSQKNSERTRTISIPVVWAGLHQQNPIPSEGSIIKPAWLKFYDELPRDVVPVGISCDSSFKEENNDGSYVVLQAWGRDREGIGPNFYLLDQIRERMDFAPTVESLKTLIIKFQKATARWIEDKANGSAIISALRNEIPGLIPVNPEGGKVSRLQAVAPFFKAGNVWLPQRAPWLPDYITEITYFPGAENDDQVDATSQALTQMGLGYAADLDIGPASLPPPPEPTHQHPKIIDSRTHKVVAAPDMARYGAEQEGPVPQEPEWRPKLGTPTAADLGLGPGSGSGGDKDPMY